jgi:hypothetical protein
MNTENPRRLKEQQYKKGIRQLQQHDMPPKPEVMPGAPETG